jgi:hypothetical protein
VLLVILLVMLGAVVIISKFGHSRFGYVGWSPAVVFLLAIGFLYYTGHLRLH